MLSYFLILNLLWFCWIIWGVIQSIVAKLKIKMVRMDNRAQFTLAKVICWSRDKY